MNRKQQEEIRARVTTAGTRVSPTTVATVVDVLAACDGDPAALTYLVALSNLQRYSQALLWVRDALELFERVEPTADRVFTGAEWARSFREAVEWGVVRKTGMSLDEIASCIHLLAQPTTDGDA